MTRPSRPKLRVRLDEVALMFGAAFAFGMIVQRISDKLEAAA